MWYIEYRQQIHAVYLEFMYIYICICIYICIYIYVYSMYNVNEICDRYKIKISICSI